MMQIIKFSKENTTGEQFVMNIKEYKRNDIIISNFIIR